MISFGDLEKIILGIITVLLCGCSGSGWQARLGSELPLFGHRNWIVVADSAYPKQSASGIETIYTGASQTEVLDTVLTVIDAASHVRVAVLLDAELERVTGRDAPGVQAYREWLKGRLEGRPVTVMPHEEIIHKLDADAKLYNILLLKTDMVIPYTSVFLQLDCAYWSAEQEKRLRDDQR
jgi:L-fucose mutarotase/ribose pyranase (RbsD/FucU family)